MAVVHTGPNQRFGKRKNGSVAHVCIQNEVAEVTEGLPQKGTGLSRVLKAYPMPCDLWWAVSPTS